MNRGWIQIWMDRSGWSGMKDKEIFKGIERKENSIPLSASKHIYLPHLRALHQRNRSADLIHQRNSLAKERRNLSNDPLVVHSEDDGWIDDE